MDPSTSGSDAKNSEDVTINVPSRFSLTVTSGPCSGQSYCPKGYFWSVGRTRASKVHIKDGSVSEKHAEICWDGAAWSLKDLGSSNGTQLNGRRIQPLVEPVALKNGDIILFGTDSTVTVELAPQTLDDITIEQMMQAQHETFVQKLEEHGRAEAKAMLMEWSNAKAEMASS